jgi:hypothetical protein
VAANACNGRSVEITWDTDENANSVVNYGTTPAYGSTVSDPTLVTSHFIEFDGLQMGTTYYYEVCSTDQASNTACSGPYTFTTPMIYTPPLYHAGYTAQYDYGTVLDDDDMWTGHNTTYAGIRHGIFQFVLTDLPCRAYIKSVQVVLWKQADQFDDMQADTWSCNLIKYFADLPGNATYDNIHNADILLTMTPTWTTAQLAADGPYTQYTLTLPDPLDIIYFNPKGSRAVRLTFRMDGATAGDDIMSWDTGYRQDIGSLGVCYKPQLIITYDFSGECITVPRTPGNEAITINSAMASLASFNISVAETQLAEILDLLEEAEEVPEEVEELLEQLKEALAKAQEFFDAGNFIAANYWACQALAIAQQILALIS